MRGKVCSPPGTFNGILCFCQIKAHNVYRTKTYDTRRSREAWQLFFTRCDVFCDLLQCTHTHKCNIFVLYNKNSNGLLKDFEPNPHCIARVPVTEILDPARRLILGHHYCSPLFQQVVPGRCSRNQVSVLDLPVWYAFKTSLTAGSFTSGLMQRLEQQRCKMFLLPLTFSDNTADTSGRTLLANESVSYSCENKRCKY